MYKLNQLHPINKKQTSVTRLADNACIPFDHDNADYQEYLKWVAEGNEPLPAEE
jgi:hypothetical protein